MGTRQHNFTTCDTVSLKLASNLDRTSVKFMLSYNFDYTKNCEPSVNLRPALDPTPGLDPLNSTYELGTRSRGNTTGSRSFSAATTWTEGGESHVGNLQDESRLFIELKDSNEFVFKKNQPGCSELVQLKRARYRMAQYKVGHATPETPETSEQSI